MGEAGRTAASKALIQSEPRACAGTGAMPTTLAMTSAAGVHSAATAWAMS